MASSPESTACQHERLTLASGGFYVICEGCGQTWVARRMGAASDTDLDHAPARTSITPLVGRGVWKFASHEEPANAE